MTQDSMRYDLMVEGALRAVVHEALTQVSANGLPGDHHIYITFLTNEAGVEIPKRLHERYPEEMTIVLQYQFWDLKIGDTAFSVVLSFDDIRETLRVPFAAITAFADPSVNFGLQFKFEESSGEDVPSIITASSTMTTSEPPETEEKSTSKKAEKPDTPPDGNVVTLDTFRKK